MLKLEIALGFPRRAAASDPEDDEAFLRRVRERAEEQRRAHERRQRAEGAGEGTGPGEG